MKNRDKTIYIPYPKQLYLHLAYQYADEILYGGSAGGGKTFSMLFDAYIKCVKYPGIRVAIFRRTFPELERTFIQKSLRYFDSSMGYYNRKTRTWTIYTPSVPSTIEFCHCRKESDVFIYQSAEYDVIYIDELTHFSEFQYTYLISRLRSSATSELKMRPHIICATNPGGIGHGWVRRYWRIYSEDVHYKVFEDDETVSSLTSLGINIPPMRRVFIPAKVYDNYYIIKNDPQYIARLASSPYAKQLLDGDWSVFTGQAFPDFDEKKHAIPSFPIPSNWKRWISIDYGYSRPFCALWHAQDPVTGKVYTYREVYKIKLSDIEQAELVMELSKNEEIEAVIVDPSTFAAKGSGSSIAQTWIETGLKNVVKGNNSRIDGWIRVHDWLKLDKNDEPIWYVFKDKCPNLVRTMPEMVYSVENPEDIDTTAEDHAVDALRYFFMHIPPPRFTSLKSISVEKAISNLDPISKQEWDYVREKILIPKDEETSISNELRALDE